jgi:hypothetical protein
MKAEGFSFVKTYSKLDLATFTAIVDEAHRQGVRVVGHIPGRGRGETESWLQPGYEMVMHAEEFAYQTDDPAHWTDHIPDYVALARKHGVLLCATLALDAKILEQMRDPGVLQRTPGIETVNPLVRAFWSAGSPYAHASAGQIRAVAAVVAFNSGLVKAYADAGLPVFAGTDTLVPGVVAGVSLHDELEALVAAGLTPQEVLVTDTRRAAEFLGVSGDRGTVEVGKRADLLLLDADPMADIANTRRIAGVVAGGRWLPRAELDRRMADLARRYAARAPAGGASAASAGLGGRFPVD